MSRGDGWPLNPHHSLCVGVMSGTSGDGVDVAIVELAGAPPALTVKLVYFETVPFTAEVQAAIFRSFDFKQVPLIDVSKMNFVLGHVFADAVVQVVEHAHLAMNDILLISSHGQTVYHGPDEETICGIKTPSLLQLGESSVIAERTGRPVVSDFRVRDMAAGGQGAPLVPFFDALLLSKPDDGVIAANIGGIANLTVLPAAMSNAQVIAFDTGPGNMIVDGIVRKATEGAQAFDKDGKMAALGRVDEGFLQRWLALPYFSRRPPKSTGRELFGEPMVEQWWLEGRQRGLRPQDLVATATEFTVRTFCDAIADFVLPYYEIGEIVVAGGGSYNPAMMNAIRKRFPQLRVLTQSESGIPSDAKEAVAFAVLGYERYHARPNNLPSATGARHGVVMGKITI